MADDSLVKTLADIGFMATSNNMPKQAFAIFYGLEKARPDSPLPHIGYAFQYMNKKLHRDALDILHKKALPLDENNPVTKAFIGMALMFEGRNKESEDYLADVSAADDESAKIMANELLSHIHKR
ncbi:hypothetical protein GZ77_04270 [Endozoicomonas montiporae]|uniref:Type III secretion protein n=2 Tax=Endozoicomonas montiporae TaxID=1027273 RepID=A0A081NBE8_9GAMM|nr:hypothetical protein [Endozoicomonas montiporae]AMO56048.1 type III secretion protein G [Endozoicomonas montiporae CL-33]KEQ15771.1 hypothetical protein GZ77_04270 [Endozoicomonas montiporae]